MKTQAVPVLFDAHVHLREGETLKTILPQVTKFCDQAIVMPNTLEAVTSPRRLREYGHEIREALPKGSQFKAHMTFELREDTPVAQIADLVEEGAIAAKVYPYKLTTNSGHGVRNYQALYPLLHEMQRHDLVLCLHGEQPNLPLDGLQWLVAEARFIDETLKPIVQNFPHLRIVLEHISTAYAVATVKQLHSVHATITAHHLVLNHDDVGGYRMCPDNFCKPVAKRESDRLALVDAAVSNNPKFFFGSDSAPHRRSSKERGQDCCAGCYTSPMVVPLLVTVFERAGRLACLADFVRTFGLSFYRIEDTETGDLTVEERPWQIPSEIDGFAPFMAGKTLPWRMAGE